MATSKFRSNLSSLKKAIGLKSKPTKIQSSYWVLEVVYRLRNEYSEIAYGIRYADLASQVDLDMCLSLRSMSASKMAILVIAIHESGIRLKGDVSNWLRQNRDFILS